MAGLLHLLETMGISRSKKKASSDTQGAESGGQYESTHSEVEVESERYGKFIVYVDESGDHGLANVDPQFPVFTLAFCIFHKRYYSEEVVSALEKLKFDEFGHDQVILHEHDIRKEKGAFSYFLNRADKERFIDSLATFVDESNFILVSCVIDKLSIREQNGIGENPYHIALGHCLEMLYEFLEEKSEYGKKTHIVFECRGKKEDKDLELEFRRICDGNNRKQLSMPFEIIFSDKKAMSTGLQLADLVARPISLSVIRPTQKNRAFDVLERKFYCSGGRKNVGKNYKGVGLKNISNPRKAKSPGETHRSQNADRELPIHLRKSVIDKRIIFNNKIEKF